MSNQFFKDLKVGLEDAIAYKKGKLDLRSELIEVPEPPIEYRAQAIKKIRETNNYSQGYFAKVLNVSVKTVQSWESGQRLPSGIALRLLEVIDKGMYCPQVSKRS